MNIVAVIPARSGSKSIKDKNITPYKGKPLIYYSIKTALKSKYINRVIVSTDSNKYRKISMKFGAEVPFLRPKKYSTDNSVDYDYIQHASKFLIKKKYYPDLIILLRPSTPNRITHVVDMAINFFIKNLKKYDSMRSVSEFSQPAQKLFMIKDKQLKGFFDKSLRGEYHAYPRQKFPKTYLPNGYIDIIKTANIIKKKFHGDKVLPYIVNDFNSDIDSLQDYDYVKNKVAKK